MKAIFYFILFFLVVYLCNLGFVQYHEVLHKKAAESFGINNITVEYGKFHLSGKTIYYVSENETFAMDLHKAQLQIDAIGYPARVIMETLLCLFFVGLIVYLCENTE